MQGRADQGINTKVLTLVNKKNVVYTEKPFHHSPVSTIFLVLLELYLCFFNYGFAQKKLKTNFE